MTRQPIHFSNAQEHTMQFIPYLNFDGNCAEAFAFYKDLFV